MDGQINATMPGHWWGKAVNIYARLQVMGDPRVTSWPLMQSPWAVSAIVVAYLVLVKQGPRLMEPHKPLNLQRILVVYNLSLVCLSCYMFYEFLVSAILANYNLRCQPVDYSNDPLAMRMANVCWVYFASKVVELLDTMFFILRKKNGQMTFLHVFHHSTMVILWWLTVKYIAGGHTFFHPLLNSLVHIFMYSYYGLSALGPVLHRYLWWKKYLTSLQLIQFCLIIIHLASNIFGSHCGFPVGWSITAFCYVVIMIILFANFYRATYRSRGLKKE
ncbi:elongation of very long chain fatty acids protein 7-like [Haliotis rufescens]|uniref:elongation of very long chain fatty acids protein 7-like n=1 Tax=Haliotis rufescens TaxID=6454 RepID=UPI001EAFEC06|nr:elongation of very long chain fatty acids protein 7-like [Haliotis rufescens]XP_046353433.1 elongation of very long chain fatty acids protein 7-like [Haliotis rufescens]XP_046353434.1 elongation of very long chain fatty acids protein 7-like [Haliotis rufescens]XP_046353435.1 elongation of very long chain fatty acids protein 7-like [Haliotis rufescens]XP_046353436.1 elongation of very long chain fatty acids protein 7-like [Haliotis rufescens]